MSNSQYLILNIGDHSFATNVDKIEDVIKLNRKTAVPLAKQTIGGLLNLRGHIVTEINVAKTLGISKSVNEGYAIVINHNDELYSLAFDGIGYVVDIGFSQIEPLPETIQKSWQDVSKGVYRMEDKLVVLLDLELFVENLIDDKVVDLDADTQYA